MSATVAGDAATKSFQPGGKPLPLALRLSGKFKTAFPDGKTVDKAAKPKPPAARGTPAEGVGRGELGGAGGRRGHAAGRRRGGRAGSVRPPRGGALQRQPRLRAGHGGAVRGGRQPALAQEPRLRLPPAHRRARDGGPGAGAVLRQDQGAGGRDPEDHREPAEAAEGPGRRPGRQIGPDPVRRGAGRDGEVPQARGRDQALAEGPAQEPAPGRRARWCSSPRSPTSR